MANTSPKKSSASNLTRNASTEAHNQLNVGRSKARLAGLLAVVIIVAISARLWHDFHRAATPASAGLPAAEAFARDHPNDVDAELNLGIALRDAGRLDESSSALSRALELNPQDPRVHVALASLSLVRMDRGAAKAHLQDALRISPNDIEAARILGDLFYKDNEIRPALEAYRKVTDLAPNDGQAWKRLGLIYRQTQLVPNAYQALRRAAAIIPDDWEINYNLGDVCMALGYLDEAGRAIARARAERPDDPETAVNMTMLAVRTDWTPEALAKALKQVDLVIAARPSAAAFLSRGRIRLAQKQYVSSIADFKSALKLEPQMVPAYIYLSQAYARNGQPELARAASNRYSSEIAAQERAMKAMAASSGQGPQRR